MNAVYMLLWWSLVICRLLIRNGKKYSWWVSVSSWFVCIASVCFRIRLLQTVFWIIEHYRVIILRGYDLTFLCDSCHKHFDSLKCINNFHHLRHNLRNSFFVGTYTYSRHMYVWILANIEFFARKGEWVHAASDVTAIKTEPFDIIKHDIKNMLLYFRHPVYNRPH